MKPKTHNLFAYSAIGATSLFLALLFILHFLKPEISPLWRVISEYQIGEFGWLMSLAFFSLAIGSIGMVLLLKSQVKTLSGKIGLFLLSLTTIGLVIAGIFPADPITTSRDGFSMAGTWHNIGGMLVVPLIPFVAMLVSVSLVKHNQKWKPLKNLLLSLTAIIWLSLVAYFAIYGISGQTGPETWIGIPNRIFMTAYCLWLIAVGIYALRLKR